MNMIRVKSRRVDDALLGFNGRLLKEVKGLFQLLSVSVSNRTRNVSLCTKTSISAIETFYLYGTAISTQEMASHLRNHNHSYGRLLLAGIFET